MNKEFIPYNLALELKDLGFDEPCIEGYDGRELKHIYQQFISHEHSIRAPLYQQAFRWFREKHNLYVEYMIGDDYNKFVILHKANDTMTKKVITFSNWMYKTYEEAEIACLNKLIEIIKIK